MRNILFVDDEQKILDGLKRMLRPKRNQWNMAFVSSGGAALEEMKARPYDVIVSDMRMAGMDGAELLTIVKNLYPRAIRLVLSGYTEMEMAIRSVPVAHQFLSKPCDADLLQETIERAIRLQELLSNEQIRSCVGNIRELPTLPQAYSRLTQTLTDQMATLKDISVIIGQDMGMSVKVLQLANSAFFGLPRRITSIETAVSILGLNMLKNLVLSVEVFRSFQGKSASGGLSLREEQSHAIFTATVAKGLLSGKQEMEDAFMGGMLHDIGRLVLMTQMPEEFGRAVALMKSEGIPLHLAEKQILGINHAEIGGYLLGIWGLPYNIVEAVACHHAPQDVKPNHLDVVTAVSVADFLVHEYTASRAQGPAEPYEKMDAALLEALNVRERVPEWNAMVEALSNVHMGT